MAAPLKRHSAFERRTRGETMARRIRTARLAIEVWAGPLAAVRIPAYRPSCRSHGATRPTGVAAQPALVAGFADRQIEIERVEARGDRTLAFVRFRGRHTGEYEGRAPSGRMRYAVGYVVHRFDEADCIVDEWTLLRWD